MGPQGPAGLSAQQVVSSAMLTVTLTTGDPKFFDLACPTGKRVFGGGYDMIGDGVVPTSSYPPSQTGWRVVVRPTQSTGAIFSFRIYAVCANSN